MRGKDIKNLRLLYGITQEQLARVMNISPQTIYYWESEASRPTRYDIAVLRRLQEMHRNRADRERAMRALQAVGLAIFLGLLFGTGEPVTRRRRIRKTENVKRQRRN